jgi:hypothetical protein
MAEISTSENICNEEFQESIILKEKDGICISRTSEGKYCIKFEMSQLLDMPSFIDFNIFKLIMELNKDIFETSSIDIISSNEANVHVKLQQFLSDYGMQCENHCLNVRKIHSELSGKIIKTIFHINSIVDENELNIRALHYDSFVECTFLTNNSVSVVITQSITNELILPYAEKMGVNVSGKIISRLKQFIENMGNI